jgi:serine/threonine protein phosphatase PrpC
MSALQLRYAAATDVGLVREVNEDGYVVAPPVFLVADGMGGHAGGDIASAIVVEEFSRLADATYDADSAVRAVTGALEACQRRIEEHAAGRVGRSAPGTTVAGVVLVGGDEPAWLVVNLGDSRVYRMCGGELWQVSRDHSLVQELLDSGEIIEDEVADHPERHVITRALGGPRFSEPDLTWLAPHEADRLLVCTDGVNGLVDDAAIQHILASNPDPAAAAQALVAAALDAGGEDNATAVVLDVVG